MQFKTHCAVAACVLVFIFPRLTLGTRYMFCVLFMLFALFPDIDTAKGTVGSAFKPISWILSLVTKHRGIIHSIWPPLVMCIIILTLTTTPAYAIAIFNGYMLHLLLDSLTPAGVQPLAPLINTKLRGPFRTGGYVDYCLFAVSIISGVFWLLFM